METRSRPRPNTCLKSHSRRTRNDGKEVISMGDCLISATITREAKDIYDKWAKTRSASDNISLAICELQGIKELNEALITQLNIHKSRWRFLEQQMQYLMTEGGYNAAQILKFSQAEDSLYYRKE